MLGMAADLLGSLSGGKGGGTWLFAIGLEDKGIDDVVAVAALGRTGGGGGRGSSSSSSSSSSSFFSFSSFSFSSDLAAALLCDPPTLTPYIASLATAEESDDVEEGAGSGA